MKVVVLESEGVREKSKNVVVTSRCNVMRSSYKTYNLFLFRNELDEEDNQSISFNTDKLHSANVRELER